MSDKLLEIKNLRVQYKTMRSTVCALNGVSFSIERGRAIGLVGEAGAGKTTTALSILNLLPEDIGSVTEGDILYNGKSVLKMSQRELLKIRGSRISMIFQNPLTSLNPVFTVGEQIAMVLRKHMGMGRKEANERAKELLETVGIPSYRLNDYPNQFSGGMRQRVGIAAGLACNPELLIADEPTTALDVTIQAQILDLISDLQTKYKTSLLMITHNLGIIAELCQDVAVMYAGRIVEYGTVAEVFQNPAHPYTVGLLNAIPKLEGERERLHDIPGKIANAQNLPSGCAFHPRCAGCTGRCMEENPGMIRLNDNHYVACYQFTGGVSNE